MARAQVWAAVVLAIAGCAGSGPGVSSEDARSREPLTNPNPIVAENQLTGTSDWHLDWWAGPHVIEGYAGEVSVNHGEPVDIHLSADSNHAVHWELFRMGYYGGLGARRVAQGDASASKQVYPAANTTTGLVECHWPTSFVIQTLSSWTSGVYVVRVTRDDGPQQYVTFVVRADEHKGAAVFQASVTTYQAYNTWGGESLYQDRALGLSGGHAREVSFNRPYIQGGGMGEFDRYEMYFARWAEARGYDLTYLTDVDLDRDPSLLTGQKLFMSVGHDEYWSHDQRAAVESAIAHGVNAAFFSGNAVYWQIRLEPSRIDGTARRTEVCWKDDSHHTDPLYGQPNTTVMFREAPVNDPETSLMGVMYDAWQLSDSSWVVQNADNWVYADAGVHDGDTIPLIVGYESDRLWSNGHTPPRVTTLASEPALQHDGSPSWHNASVYTAYSGAFVFAAGTIQFSWGLSKELIADARIQRVAANVLERAGLAPASAGDDFGAGTWPSADTHDAKGTVSTFAGTAFQTGMANGPAAQATFNRPVGAAIDGNGVIYIADTGNNAIRRIANDAAHTVTTIAGTGQPGTTLGGPGDQTSLWQPTDVAVSPSGDIYVADTDNERILQIASGSWYVSVFAGSPVGEPGRTDGRGTAARFAEPQGLAFVGSDLYVADTSNSLIRKIDANGNVTTIAGGGGEGYADGPGASASFYRPTSIVGGDGALWVVDANNRLLRKIALDAAYTVTTVAGTTPGGFLDGPALDAQLMPWFGILERGGNIYWTDTGTQRVRMLSGGVVSTIAGSGMEAPTNGAAASAGFVLPSAIVPMQDGKLLIVDNGSSTLRILDRGEPLPGTSSTTGTGGATSSATSTTGGAGTTAGAASTTSSAGATSTSGTTAGTATGTGSTTAGSAAATATGTTTAGTSAGTTTGGAASTTSGSHTPPTSPPQSSGGSGGCGSTGAPFELAALLAAIGLGRRRAL